MSENPLVSVIIAVYNGEKYLENTIKSILSQKYKNIELIIIDGGSSDNTISIIEKYRSNIKYYISEKDSGISEAFNKGLDVADGDFINFQGDGDGFTDQFSVEKMMENINPDENMFISGRIKRIDLNNNLLYYSKKIKKFNKYSLFFKMSLPHQGLFTNRVIFQKYGNFDINNKYCMDYEHLLRCFKDFPDVIVKNIVIANWRCDGLGNGKTLDIFREYNIIKHKNEIASPIILFLINLWIHFKFYTKSVLSILDKDL